jgi:hypothetical protein
MVGIASMTDFTEITDLPEPVQRVIALDQVHVAAKCLWAGAVTGYLEAERQFTEAFNALSPEHRELVNEWAS